MPRTKIMCHLSLPNIPEHHRNFGVRHLSSDLLLQVNEFLPNLFIHQGTYVCFYCREQLMRLIEERKLNIIHNPPHVLLRRITENEIYRHINPESNIIQEPQAQAISLPS